MIGAGAWGTALADLLSRNGHEVRIWAYEWDVVETINRSHQNRRFLPGCQLSDTLRACNELSETLEDAELVAVATPSHVTREILKNASEFIRPTTPLVLASKGIEQDTLSLMTDIAAQELGGARVVALSGPSFAAEVAARQPTAVVVAATDPADALLMQTVFSSTQFRAYTHTDVTGVEVGGSLKNVMAVATGIADGLGLGFNARAALITRGLAEMTRLGVRLGADASTFAGLAGLGDLVLTCTGSLSRNRSVGVEIGRGVPLEKVLAGRDTVAEGVITTRSAHALATREGVAMPIVDAVYRVLFQADQPRDAIHSLMTRELRTEAD